MDASAGSGTLAELGNAHLALILRVLKRGAYNEAAGRRLAAIAANTETQTGWFSFDAGQHDAAQTTYAARSGRPTRPETHGWAPATVVHRHPRLLHRASERRDCRRAGRS